MIVTLDGYYGRNNFGDDLMLEEILTRFQANNIRVNLIIRKDDLKFGTRFSNVNIFFTKAHSPLYNLKTFLLALRKSEALIWGGGTCFSDEDGVNIKAFLIAKLLLKKILYIGIGVGSITGMRMQKAKIITRLASLITVRDEFSYKKLTSFSSKNNIQQVSDISYVSRLIKKKSTVDNHILVNLRNLDKYLGDDYKNMYRDNLLNEIYEISKKLSKKIVVCPFADIDNTENLRIFELLKRRGALAEYIGEINIFERIKLIQESSFIYTERLHSFIVAVINEKRVIPLNYSPKFKFFIEEIKWKGESINISECTKIKEGFFTKASNLNPVPYTLPVNSSELNFKILFDFLLKA